MSNIKESIKDNIAAAADATKNAGKQVVDKIAYAGSSVKEKAKEATKAAGDMVQSAGKMIHKQGE